MPPKNQSGKMTVLSLRVSEIFRTNSVNSGMPASPPSKSAKINLNLGTTTIMSSATIPTATTMTDMG